MKTRSLVQVAMACLLLTLTGCSNPGVFKFSKDEFPKTGPKNPVVRILGLWEPAEGMAMGKTSRGFNAQILFFGQNSDLPAQVDGDVRIYVFDDQGREEDRAMPFHQLDYPAETWKAFLANGPLGATYPVFVPYIRPGTHEAKCTLRVRFTPKGGFPVYSDMVNIVMPGTKKAKDKDEAHSAAEKLDKSENSPEPQNPDVVTRKPPRATGASNSFPSPQEIQEQLHAKRPHATELNGQERRRIMREAKVRLQDDEDSRISLAGYEEQEPDQSIDKTSSDARNMPSPRSDDVDEFFDTPTEDEPVVSDNQAETTTSGEESSDEFDDET